MTTDHIPIVLTIAGSDSSAGAGIQADLKTVAAIGGYAATAVTAVTVQNTLGVTDSHTVPPAIVRAQIEAVMSDLEPDAVKTGMLPTAETVATVADALEQYAPRPVVLDPVMISSSGRRLMSDDAARLCLSRLMPLCTLITPNLPEAEWLTGQTIRTVDDMGRAAAALSRSIGGASVVVKGGHLTDGEPCDVLYHQGRLSRHTSPMVISRNTHGTGCTYASAIATYLAMGCTVDVAVARAKQYIYAAIVGATNQHIGHGHGPLAHFTKKTVETDG